MNTAPAAEQLNRVRLDVQRACDLLIAPSPESWTACQDALQQAVSQLSDFRSRGHKLPPADGTCSATESLRFEISHATHLLRGLSDFYRGWERILGARSAGYTAGGNPANVVRCNQLECHG